jgi:RNA polymerase sigma factor (sigma-70 family)
LETKTAGLVDVDHREKILKFERAVLRHMDSAFNLARWFTRNPDDAKDLAQEALLRAFRAFDRFEGEDGRVWLLTILRNLYYTSLARKPEQTVFDEEVHSVEEFSSNPEVLLLREVEAQSVRQAIEELPAEFRGTLVLRELEGLSYKEIAAIMDLPLGTVMSRLARAREHLKRSLTASAKTKMAEKEGKNAVSGK